MADETNTAVIETPAPETSTAPLEGNDGLASPGDGDPDYAPPTNGKAAPVAKEPEAPAAEKPVAETPATPVEPVSDITDADVKMAEKYGYTADDAKAFGSKARLDRALLAIDRQIANTQARLGNPAATQPPAPTVNAPKPQPQTQPQPAAPALPSAPQSSNTIEDYIPKYNGKVLDRDEFPEIYDVALDMAKHFKGQIEAQVAALSPLLNAASMTANQVFDFTLTSQLDRLLANAGKEYEQFLGSDAFIDMDPASEHGIARAEVYRMAIGLREKWAGMGQKLSLKESLQRALRVQLFDKLDTLARQKAESEAAAGNGSSGLNKPSKPGGVRRTAPKGDAAVQENLRNRMKELGIGAPTMKDQTDELAGMTLD